MTKAELFAKLEQLLPEIEQTKNSLEIILEPDGGFRVDEWENGSKSWAEIEAMSDDEETESLREVEKIIFLEGVNEAYHKLKLDPEKWAEFKAEIKNIGG